MKLSTLVWSMLGVSVAINAFFCIFVIEFFADKPCFEAYKWHSCAALVLSGAALSVAGWRRAATAGQTEAQEAQGDLDAEVDAGESRVGRAATLFGLFKPLFWGPMLTSFGVIVMCIVPTPSVQRFADRISTNLVKRARSPQPVLVETNPAPALTSAPPVVARFPEVSLQGVIYRPAKPSVVIHGRAYFVGDYLEDALIVAIDRSSATLEIGNQQKKVYIE